MMALKEETKRAISLVSQDDDPQVDVDATPSKKQSIIEPSSLSATHLVTPGPKSDKHSIPTTTTKARNQIFNLNIAMGDLNKAMKLFAPPFDPQVKDNKLSLIDIEPFWSQDSPERNEIYTAIKKVFSELLELSKICCIELNVAIVKKKKLNAIKYPVEKCKGKCDKYTSYSSQTGITKTNQSTRDINDDTYTKSIPELIRSIRHFATERDWFKYHTPRNLTLAIMGEVGEICDLFQWEEDTTEPVSAHASLLDEEKNIHQNIGLMKDKGWTDEKVDKVQQEIADVAIYTLRLADIVGIDDMGCTIE